MSDKEVIQRLDKICRKLDKLLGVMSAQGKDKNLQIDILTHFGLTSEEISKLTGIPSGTIRYRRSTKHSSKGMVRKSEKTKPGNS